MTQDGISSTVSLTGPAQSGVLLSRQGYFSYGEVRYVTGELPAEFGVRRDSSKLALARI